MSWFVQSIGLKDAVRKDVEQQFAKQLESYKPDTEEGKDIVACRDRCLQMIDAIVVEEFANGLDVKASGSRVSSAYGGMSGSMSVTVNRIHFAI